MAPRIVTSVLSSVLSVVPGFPETPSLGTSSPVSVSPAAGTSSTMPCAEPRGAKRKASDDDDCDIHSAAEELKRAKAAEYLSEARSKVIAEAEKIDEKIRKLSERILIIKAYDPGHPKLATLRKERNRQHALRRGSFKNSKLWEIMKFIIVQRGGKVEEYVDSKPDDEGPEPLEDTYEVSVFPTGRRYKRTKISSEVTTDEASTDDTSALSTGSSENRTVGNVGNNSLRTEMPPSVMAKSTRTTNSQIEQVTSPIMDTLQSAMETSASVSDIDQLQAIEDFQLARWNRVKLRHPIKKRRPPPLSRILTRKIEKKYEVTKGERYSYGTLSQPVYDSRPSYPQPTPEIPSVLDNEPLEMLPRAEPPAGTPALGDSMRCIGASFGVFDFL